MEDEYYFQKIYPLKIYDHLDQQKQKNNKNNTNNHRYAKQLIEIDLNEQKEKIQLLNKNTNSIYKDFDNYFQELANHNKYIKSSLELKKINPLTQSTFSASAQVDIFNLQSIPL